MTVEETEQFFDSFIGGAKKKKKKSMKSSRNS